jgi:hypothetical protein
VDRRLPARQRNWASGRLVEALLGIALLALAIRLLIAAG